ncbi:hypothetical protein D3C81_607200 [compost metagenome]
MAITRIRGGQIHDRTIDGIKITQGALMNEHIAAGASIDESKLNIDWESKGVDILSSKKVVDYIQVSGTVVDGLSSVNVTALNIFGGSTPSFATSDPDLAVEGIIIDAPKNKVALRDSVTGDPVLDSHGHEVYGRMTYDDQNTSYVLKFYTEEDGSGFSTPVEGMVEVEFTMPVNQAIDWQYAQRFNLQTVNEMFAANEKFVEGAADATAHLNIEQLAKDVYGGNFTLGRDGNARLVKSLSEQLSDEISRAQIAEANLQTAIENEATSRVEADTLIRNDLASQLPGKGASVIGIQDNANNFTATSVEGALKELSDRTASLENGTGNSNEEIINARTSTITGDHANVSERLEASEARYEAVKTEVEAARNGKVDLNVRLGDIESLVSSIDNATTQEIADRIAAIDNLKVELADTTAGKGASLIGVDTTKGFTGTTVEAVLEELKTSTDEVQTNLNDYKTSNDTRVSNVEDTQTELAAQVGGIVNEIEDARGTTESINERLSVSLNADGSLKVSEQLHKHKKYITTIQENTSIIEMPVGELYVVGDGSLNVHVNGILQANGINFDEVAGGASIDFGTDELLSGDVLVIEYIVYGIQ